MSKSAGCAKQDNNGTYFGWELQHISDKGYRERCSCQAYELHGDLRLL